MRSGLCFRGSLQAALEISEIFGGREVQIVERPTPLSALENEAVNQVVKGTSNIVNNIPDEKRDFLGDRSYRSDLKRAVSSLFIVLGNNWISVSSELSPSLIEIRDMLCGPI
jgi:hypothetical protein